MKSIDDFTVLEVIGIRLQQPAHLCPAVNLVTCTHVQAQKMAQSIDHKAQLPAGDYVNPLIGQMLGHRMITYQTQAGALFCAYIASMLGGCVLYVDQQEQLLEFRGS